jgi:hypothetical protein
LEEIVAERLQCEFSLVRYVPDVVKGEFANIGVVLREAGRERAEVRTQVRFTRDWSRVRCMDPDADVDLLESLEAEIAERLLAEPQQPAANGAGPKPVLATLEDTLSNSVQLTAMQGTLAESLPAEMDQLMRLYVEPLKLPSLRRKTSGRTAIAGRMREAFDRGGVWPLLRKKIAVAQYTQPGDPLKIDCGYRPNGIIRMFHAVSLESDVEGAKGVAYSAVALRAGVARLEGAELELTAIIEPISTVSDVDQYKFGVSAMEREAIRVLTTSDLERVVATARRELRM